MIFDSYMESLDGLIGDQPEELDPELGEQPEAEMAPEPSQVNTDLKEILRERLLGERKQHKAQSAELQRRAIELQKGMF